MYGDTKARTPLGKHFGMKMKPNVYFWHHFIAHYALYRVAYPFSISQSLRDEFHNFVGFLSIMMLVFCI